MGRELNLSGLVHIMIKMAIMDPIHLVKYIFISCHALDDWFLSIFLNLFAMREQYMDFFMSNLKGRQISMDGSYKV